MAYVRKTRDEWLVQVDYGYGHGWEDECQEGTLREAHARLREYRENVPQYPARLKRVRVPIREAQS